MCQLKLVEVNIVILLDSSSILLSSTIDESVRTIRTFYIKNQLEMIVFPFLKKTTGAFDACVRIPKVLNILMK